MTRRLLLLVLVLALFGTGSAALPKGAAFVVSGQAPTSETSR